MRNGKHRMPLTKKISVAAGTLGFAAAAANYALSEKKKEPENITMYNEGTFSPTGNRIYFPNLNRSGCTVLQSGEHLALIDCGGSADVDRIKELLRYAARQDRISLDFIAVTHAHPGHIGGLIDILNDSDIAVKKLYIKPLKTEKIISDDAVHGISAQHENIIKLAKEKGVDIIFDIPRTSFDFGGFSLRFLNTDTDSYHMNIGENDNSLAVLIEKDGKKLLIAGDMTNTTGDIARLANEVGKVWLLCLPRHGEEKLSEAALKRLSPSVMIAQNSIENIPSENLGEFMLRSNGGGLYATKENGGVAATFFDGGTVYLTKNI